jgi:hypothetical protein
MNIIPPNDVGSAYEAYLEAFRRAAEMANQKVKFPDRPIRSCFSQSGNERAVFNRCLYLKGWPCRRLDANKRLDIVVKALETFTTVPEWLLTKSTVYLNYLVVSNSGAKLVQSLHYDFVAGGQPDHPLFHVQLDLELIPENELRSTGFDIDVNLPREPNECWVTSRIPTPDMTFPSVLYCLVADHLGAGIFKEFAKSIDSMLEGRLPPPNFDSLKRSMEESSAHFKSSHWFAHILKPLKASGAKPANDSR